MQNTLPHSGETKEEGREGRREETIRTIWIECVVIGQCGLGEEEKWERNQTSYYFSLLPPLSFPLLYCSLAHPGLKVCSFQSCLHESNCLLNTPNVHTGTRLTNNCTTENTTFVFANIESFSILPPPPPPSLVPRPCAFVACSISYCKRQTRKAWERGYPPLPTFSTQL